MNRIPITMYIATNNPDGANAILGKYNIRPHKTPEGRFKALNYILDNHGEQALLDFTEYHPDKGLILDLNKNSSACGSEYSGACGCSMNFSGCAGCELGKFSNCGGKSCCAKCAGEKTSGATGTTAPTKTEEKSDTIPMLIIAGFVLLGALIILKN